MLIGRAIWRDREVSAVKTEEGRIILPGPVEVRPEEVRLLTPCTPSKIVCVGRNYREHAKELGNPMPDRPLLFLKAPSALLDPGGVIRIPEDSQQVEYEGEIAVVLSRTCKAIGERENPMDYVLGVTPLNDVTARDLQKLDGQWARAKSFDTFCPFGPWVNSRFDPAELGVRTTHNGQVVQEGNARDMAFPIPDLVRYVARAMTLLPGDVIATGTPAGVGKLNPGDAVCVEVAGVRLENTVG